MKKFVRIVFMIFFLVVVSFVIGKQTDAASYKRICPEVGKQSVTFGRVKYTMKYKPNEGYIVYMVKGSSKKALLNNVGSIVITDGKNIYYTVTSLKNGIASGTSTMYKYTISTGTKSKLFREKMCDGSLEFGAVPCFAYKQYIYYGAQSQYGGKIRSLYVFNTKTKKNKKIGISASLLDVESIKKTENMIIISEVDYKFDTVIARYKFNFSGGTIKKIK